MINTDGDMMAEFDLAKATEFITRIELNYATRLSKLIRGGNVVLPYFDGFIIKMYSNSQGYPCLRLVLNKDGNEVAQADYNLFLVDNYYTAQPIDSVGEIDPEYSDPSVAKILRGMDKNTAYVATDFVQYMDQNLEDDDVLELADLFVGSQSGAFIYTDKHPENIVIRTPAVIEAWSHLKPTPGIGTLAEKEIHDLVALQKAVDVCKKVVEGAKNFIIDSVDTGLHPKFVVPNGSVSVYSTERNTIDYDRVLAAYPQITPEVESLSGHSDFTSCRVVPFGEAMDPSILPALGQPVSLPDPELIDGSEVATKYLDNLIRVYKLRRQAEEKLKAAKLEFIKNRGVGRYASMAGAISVYTGVSVHHNDKAIMAAHPEIPWNKFTNNTSSITARITPKRAKKVKGE